MNSDLGNRFSAIPPLDRRNLSSDAPHCTVCGGKSRFFDVVDFNKHCSFEDYYAFGPAGVAVPYYRCLSCGFLFTEFFKDWTPQDFGRFIYNDDYVKVDSEYVEVRPRLVAEDMARRLGGCETARILDYGSGTGAFANRMREAGFTHIVDYDPFSHPVRPEGKFDIITCFEVIEHTPDPVAAVRDMRSFLADDGCIVFSQTLQPHDIEVQRGNWWYLAPRNGHISTFTPRSLALIAASSGLTFFLGTSPHAFATQAPSDFARTALAGIGEAVVSIRLTAPPFGGETPDWHAAERSVEGRYRWTKKPVISWRAPEFISLPCSVFVSAQIINQIHPGFAERCEFRLGGLTVPVKHVDGELQGTIHLTEASTLSTNLDLVTPEPISPRALRGDPDDRKLGLAIGL
jgi:2-polyprenyl-6-hydroxyphenyl methylase/3-demethylubiquinone-9 3-methyltransferase